MAINGWEKIGDYEWLEAEIVKGVLEAEGVPVRLAGESLGLLYGLTRGPLGQRSVLVPPEDRDKAQQILERLQGNGEDEDNLKESEKEAE